MRAVACMLSEINPRSHSLSKKQAPAPTWFQATPYGLHSRSHACSGVRTVQTPIPTGGTAEPNSQVAQRGCIPVVSVGILPLHVGSFFMSVWRKRRESAKITASTLQLGGAAVAHATAAPRRMSQLSEFQARQTERRKAPPPCVHDWQRSHPSVEVSRLWPEVVPPSVCRYEGQPTAQ